MKVVDQINLNKKTILDNNSLILEILSAAGEIGIASNIRAVKLMKEQNEILKNIIKVLEKK
jgi:hypothetical protein